MASKSSCLRVKRHLLALGLVASIQLLSLYSTGRTSILVAGQDFEDLTSKQTANLPQSTFQPTFRQQSNGNNRQSRQMPSRFAPVNSQQQQSQLSAQASGNAPTFSSPQQAAASSQPAPASSSSGSGIEQIMKNALARTARLEVEQSPRLESTGAQVASISKPESQTSSRSGPATSSAPTDKASGATSPQAAGNGRENTEISETPLAEGGQDDDKSTTAAQAATTNGHDTVYSDQRFANLFSRRNNGNKRARFTPMEQIKAKPTLPSFIKSAPDLKQFSPSSDANASGSERLGGFAQGSSNIQSARLVQQQPSNQARVNLASQQKKPNPISVNGATNKRSNLLNGKQTTSSPKITNQKLTSAVSTSKPAGPLNNPFNRQQGNSDSTANVIAMARKRLLANNALESGKLRLQQQQQQQQQKPTN